MSPFFEQVSRSGVCYISEKITSFLRVFEYIRQVRLCSCHNDSNLFTTFSFIKILRRCSQTKKVNVCKYDSAYAQRILLIDK